MKQIGVVVALAGAFLVTGACSSDDAAEELRRAKIAEGCVINSDCSQSPVPLVCAFQRCHIKCVTDADCEPGLRCMLADKPVHVCQLPDEVPNPPCKYSSECPGEQLCAVDGECRDACLSAKDCVTGQLCVGGVCAVKEELDENGQLTPLPGTDGGAVECEYDSQCPGDQVCRPQGTCGLECLAAKDCAPGENCVANKCVPKGGGPTTLPEHCKNGQKDGDESAADCGGSCYPCPSGSDCGKAADCASQVCTASKCQEATCSDGVRNGSETGTDCGGPNCAACPPAQPCNGPTDCTTGICKASICVDATCADGQQNGKETDVDCGGGTCPACDGANKGCLIGGDCTSGVCTAYSCALPTCTDGVKNGKETGQDCGGTDCKACSNGKGCTAPADCVSKVCSSGTCVAGSCTDTVKNGNETDVDCGGADCAKCAGGKACTAPADCATGSCVGNLCKGTYKLTVTPAGTGAGTVKSDVGGLDCGAKCAVDILEGTSVVLTATPASSSSFTSWSGGGCTGTGTCSLTMSADVTVTATFGGVAPGGVVLTKQLGAGYQPVHPGGVDSAGNYYFNGSLDWPMDLGGGPVAPNGIDAFVAKYSPSGAWLWSRKLGGAGNQYGDRMVLEPGGDVIVVGRSSATASADFGGTSLSCGSSSVFLARYSGSDGAHKWSKCVGSGVYSVISALLDGAGNVVIAGTLEAGSTDFGTGALTATGYEMFVASFSLASGAPVAAKDFGGPGDDVAKKLVRAADGTYALVGYCSGNVDFGGGIVTTGKGQSDLCIAKLTSAWALAWVRQLGDLNDDSADTAAFTPSGKLMVAGYFKGQVDFEAGPVDVAKGEGDIVLLQMNPTTGAIEWRKIYGTTSTERVVDMAAAANGDLVLIGSNQAALSFGGPDLQPSTYCVKLSPTASYVWQWTALSWADAATSLLLTPSGGAVFGIHSGGFGATGYVLAP